MKPILFFILFLLIPCGAAEEASLFDFLKLLDYKEWDGDFASLNYVSTNPDKVIHKTSSMEAWIDIVGYRNMSRINNTDYIYDHPINCVIIEYAVDVTLGFNSHIDSIEHEESYYIIGDNLTVISNITMVWHTSTLRSSKHGSYISKTYYVSELTMSDTEEIPEQYVCINPDISVYLLYYNNSFSPKTVINIPDKNGFYFIEYSYENEIMIHQLMIGNIEKNEKGIEFVNFTKCNWWNEPTENLSHISECCVIGGNLSLEDLGIVVNTPYVEINLTNLTLTINDVSAETCINYAIIPVIVVIILLLSTLIYVIKVGF